MASTNYVCPKCGSDDIQSFKSIYESGTRMVTRQRRNSDGKIENYQTLEYTNNLAKSVAPPSEMECGWSPFTVAFWFFGGFCGIVTFALLLKEVNLFLFLFKVPLVLLIKIFHNFEMPCIIVSIIVGIITGIIAGIIADKKMGQKYKEECARIDMDNRKAREKWEHSWVCMRCSNRFVM